MDPLLTTLGLPTGVAGWNILQTKKPSDYPALTKDPVVQREIAYFEQNAPKATTPKALLADPRLQDFVLTAYGLSSESGYTALMTKVLQSNPTDSKSFASQLVDPRYTQLAAAFNYGATTTPATPAVASKAEVQTGPIGAGNNFQSFSGSFGGVTLGNVDLTQATTIQGVASSLQAAFQRADGNRTDITVKVNGEYLEFKDAQGRGTASGFSFTPNTLNTAGQQPSAPAPNSLVAGSQTIPASGGPSVTQPSFINTVVQKYLEAQFEVVAGNQSNALREARYAAQTLPNVRSWYSVIGNAPLANVVQTVLGLPQSFGALDVDQQSSTYAQRMNINDFQNPTKLSKMLTQFMAMSSESTQSNLSTIGESLLNTLGSTKPIAITISSTAPVSTFSNGSAAALILSTAFSQSS
jgi:hypothetical protein